MRTDFLSSSLSLLLLATACGDDGKTSGTTGGQTSTTDPASTGTTAPASSSSSTTVDPTTGDVSGTGTTTTDPDTTTTTDPGTSTGPVVSTGHDHTTGDTTTSTTTGPDTTTTGPDDSTGPVVDGCAALDEKMCAAQVACMPIRGQKINLDQNCLEMETFLVCTDSALCGDALTTACPKGLKEPWLFKSTCIPDDFVPCDAPPVAGLCK